MNLQRSTRYALYAAMEMAVAGDGDQVTVARVAERYAIPGAVLAKVFQRLVHAGIAVGTRGTGGGYHLTRSPSQLTLLDVIDVFEPPGKPGVCVLEGSAGNRCDDPVTCPVHQVFDEVDELTRCTYASITLETLAGRRRPREVSR